MPRWDLCCGSVVISAGAGSAGLARARDDELTVWAAEHQAAVVSTDGEFSQRRMQNAIGWHVWLRCSDWEASAVLAVPAEPHSPQSAAFPGRAENKH
jgi:predicted nuclease of predicted toxin-antitoxin system